MSIISTLKLTGLAIFCGTLIACSAVMKALEEDDPATPPPARQTESKKKIPLPPTVKDFEQER